MKQKQGILPLKPILGAVLNAYEYKGVDFLQIFNTIHSELQPFTIQFWKNCKYLSAMEGWDNYRKRLKEETGFRVGHNAMYLGIRGDHTQYKLSYLQVIARGFGYSFVDLMTRDLGAELGEIIVPSRAGRKPLNKNKLQEKAEKG